MPAIKKLLPTFSVHLTENSDKNLIFAMKFPVAARRPLSLSLYNLIPSTPHKHLPSSSLFSFPNSSLSRQVSAHSMAACIDASRTQKPHLSRDPNRPRAADNAFHHLEFCRPGFSNRISHVPIKLKGYEIKKTIHTRPLLDDLDPQPQRDDVWTKMQQEAKSDVEREPILSNYYHSSILSQGSIETALANHLSIKLSNSSLPSKTLHDLFESVLESDFEIMDSVKEDLMAVKERDPACISHVHCFLNFKGFLACQAHRIAHKLWSQERKTLALLIQSRVSDSFSVDIHPGAKIGRGVLLDHATGLVIGETAVVGNNVSILHGVTLGGTGKQGGDRHPKIGDGVLIGAGTCILGNVRIGEGAKIGAGSVVLKDVPARTTAVGNPARLLGGKDNPVKLDTDPGLTMDHTSGISEWSDYVI